MTLGYSCFPVSWHRKDTPPSVSQMLAEGAKRMSQDLAREMPPTPEDEFCLRLRGFERDDPIVRETREERIRCQYQTIEAKRRLEEEDLRLRMQHY